MLVLFANRNPRAGQVTRMIIDAPDIQGATAFVTDKGLAGDIQWDVKEIKYAGSPALVYRQIDSAPPVQGQQQSAPAQGATPTQQQGAAQQEQAPAPIEGLRLPQFGEGESGSDLL